MDKTRAALGSYRRSTLRHRWEISTKSMEISWDFLHRNAGIFRPRLVVRNALLAKGYFPEDPHVTLEILGRSLLVEAMEICDGPSCL